jgi:L-ascorbate metabolism protein UlaG (beta-lactamase superfamily)
LLRPVTSGADLIREIDLTITPTPALWWLGHAGFVIRFANITFYIDPCFSDLSGKPRLCASPLSGDQVHHADMILATHAHAGHLDTPSLIPMLAESPLAKVVVPRSSADFAHASGIPYDRITPTDNGLRIEYFKENLYGRIYAVPSAHPRLDWNQSTGFPYLGYLIRFGRWTIYHAGDCAMYPGLADRLRPFNVNVALLPIGGSNFTVSEAAQLAEDIGAAWAIPMHHGTFSEDHESAFVAHMLGRRPGQRFHVFRCGEKWTVPEE